MTARVHIATCSIVILLLGSLCPQPLSARGDNGKLSPRAFIRLVFGDSEAFDDTTSQADDDQIEFKSFAIDTHIPSELSRNLPKDFIEHGADVTSDGQYLWFVSSRDRTSLPAFPYSHDLWRARILNLDSMIIDEPSRLYFDSLGINTEGHEGAFSFNGRIIIYAGCDYEVGFGDCDLYMVDLNASAPVRRILPEPVNTEHWESQPFLTEKLMLFFASNRSSSPGAR